MSPTPRVPVRVDPPRPLRARQGLGGHLPRGADRPSHPAGGGADPRRGRPPVRPGLAARRGRGPGRLSARRSNGNTSPAPRPARPGGRARGGTKPSRRTK